MNTATNIVNKLLSFVGKPPVGIPDTTKADADKALLDSFMQCCDKYGAKKITPPDTTKVSVLKSDLQGIKAVKSELAGLLNDLFENRDKFLDGGFYRPHLQQALRKMDNIIQKFNI